jgi:hypothetical protein
MNKPSDLQLAIPRVAEYWSRHETAVAALAKAQSDAASLPSAINAAYAAATTEAEDSYLAIRFADSGEWQTSDYDRRTGECRSLSPVAQAHLATQEARHRLPEAVKEARRLPLAITELESRIAALIA